jgi:ComF family protein
MGWIDPPGAGPKDPRGARSRTRLRAALSLLSNWREPAARSVGDWFPGLAAFVYPNRCAACGAEADPDRPLCPACWVAVPRAELVVCARCLGLELEPVGCLRHPGFRVGVAWVYDERAAAVIGAFKYGERTDLAAPLAGELARLPLPLQRPDVVVEVPLHPARRRERGYNQAELLAGELSARLGVPWLPGVLERTRPTPAQARLGARARRANLANSIRVRRPETLARRRILVVDDVITTGATLGACLAALRAGGAEAAALAVAWAQ